jgi:Zn-dependent protease
MKLLILALLSLKSGKLLLTAGTMLVSIAVYASIWGWPYAVGFVLLIFAHEMGHFVAARQRGLNVGAPTFIPFVGAWIQLKETPMSVETEAYVAFAGPFVGTLAAFAVYFYGRAHDSGLCLALAYAGFFLNLFNLLPISPLDGGRITAVLTPRIWLVGVPLMLGLLLYQPSPMLVLLAILAAPHALRAWRYDPGDPALAAYYNVPLNTRVEYTVMYLGLAALLGLMTYRLHIEIGASQ